MASDARRLGEGYFLLMIQPQEDERLTKSPPREIVFLVDVSGSMSGLPTQKVIDAMQHMLKLCRPQDTVQVITFASQSQKLFERPVPVNEENIKRALNFTQGLRGGGGTEMLKGVKLAIDEPLDQAAGADRGHADRRLHRQRSRDHRARRQELRRSGPLLGDRHRQFAEHVPDRRRRQARRRDGQEAGPGRRRRRR